MSQLLYTIQRRGRGLGCGCNRRGISDIWDEYQYADQQNYFLESGGGYGSDFYYGGGGGGSFANPPDNWSGNTGIFNWNWDTGSYNTPGINPDPNGGGIFDGSGWFDPYSGLYFDPYGGVYDTMGTGIFDPGPLLDTINTSEIGLATPIEGLTLDLHPLIDVPTINWWDSLSSDNPDTLPIVEMNWDKIIASIPQSYPGPIPAQSASKEAKKNFLKALAEFGKKTLQSAAGGSSSGGNSAAGKPATTQPNAQGECPQGYVLNPQTKQCVKIPAKPNSDLLTTLTSNPLYLMLGAIGLILLAKK